MITVLLLVPGAPTQQYIPVPGGADEFFNTTLMSTAVVLLVALCVYAGGFWAM